MWRLNKEEIGHWLETKECDFTIDQNKNPQINIEKWLHWYVFTDLDEIFFVNFWTVLVEWIQRLAIKNKKLCTVVSRNWTLDFF
jgi:hypothetical protein